MCKYKSVLSWTGSPCPNPKPGCGMVGAVPFPANALRNAGSSCFPCSSPRGSWAKAAPASFCPRPKARRSLVGERALHGAGGCSMGLGSRAGAEPGGCCHGAAAALAVPSPTAPVLSPPGHRACQGTRTVSAGGSPVQCQKCLFLHA